MARPKKTGILWYNQMDIIHSYKYRNDILRDIKNNPYIEKEITEFRESFIKFACLERMSFEPNIKEEIQAYYKRKRMYNYNSKEWKRISKEVFHRDNYVCYYCGEKGGKLEVDHIVPFSKGGSDEMDNLITSCLRCNRQKRDKSIKEFLKWKERHE